MKIFQTHDENFDVCRSFLVLSMIFTHIFEMFYLPDYNRRLTYFVTIGFIFFSGFTIGALYTERIVKKPKENFRKMMMRALKLVLLFLFCNIIIFLTNDDKWIFFSGMGIGEIILSIAMGTHQNIYGFDILVPIAMTTFFSYFFLLITKKLLNISSGVFGFFLILLALNIIKAGNYYGILMVISGLLGCVLGDLSYQLKWDVFIQKASSGITLILLGCIIIIYYFRILIYSSKGSEIQIGYHLLPTIILLFFIYLISIKFKLAKRKIIKFLNKTLANYMLFAYLFHIFIINLLFFIIQKDSQNSTECLAVGFFVLAITVKAIQGISFLSSKYISFSKVYDTIFKL